VNQTVLLVDDDESLRQVMGQYLTQEGYRVLSAGSGAEGLRLFYAERPDAVLLDLMMPGMDGWEVCARLRELSDAPILLVTARTSQEDKLRGFRLGIDDYLSKPFSLAELAARLQAVLARSHKTGPLSGKVITWHELRMDLGKRQVWCGEKMVLLTPTEFRMLEILIRKKGSVATEEELREEIGETSARWIPPPCAATSGSCARSWKATRPSRRACWPCAARATGWDRNFAL
jgi:DNA-binding response OmpR family regulator